MSQPEIAVIVNSLKEGPRLAATCRDFHDHLAERSVAHEIIACDDGTPDGPGPLPDYARLVRHEETQGCARSKLDSTALATARTLLWVDAHQAPLEGDLRDLISMALAERIVVCPITSNMAYDAEWRSYKYGGLKQPNNFGLLPQPARQYLPMNAVQAPLYAVSVGLCMSRETYGALGGWNNYSATHGSQERGMALRAFMAGVPVRFCPSVTIGHEFYGSAHPSRNKSPWPRMRGAYSTALLHAYATVCTEETTEYYVRQFLDDDQPVPPEAVVDRAHFARYCKRRPDQDLIALLEDLFAHDDIPADKGTSVLEPAALRIIAASARGRCLELGTGSGAGTKALLAGATEVVTVDHDSRFSAEPHPRVTQIHTKLGADRFYDLEGAGVAGPFDLAVVDGPPFSARRTAARHVLPLLSQSGVVLVDDANRDTALIDSWCRDFNLSRENARTRRGLAILRPRTWPVDLGAVEPAPFWRDQGEGFYRPMIRRHQALWDRVVALLKEREITSVLEIGCGMAHIAEHVPRYCGLDMGEAPIALARKRNAGHINHESNEFIVGDWMTMDPAPFAGRFDCVVACGVIEHVPHWRPFLEKALAVGPRLVLVSFFMSMDATHERIRKVEAEGQLPYFTNRYPRADVDAFLEGKGTATWEEYPHATGRDALLILGVRTERKEA